MFLSLGIILTIGSLGGFLFEKIHLPKLIFYLILGILLSPTVFNIIDPQLLEISSYLRQIALVIILTRSGLSLDFKALKKIGLPAILLSFIPASFEMIGIAIFAPLILKISITEALLMGCVLAAVSPAVVVPRMIKLKNQGYGVDKNVAQLIMAGSSADDIYVIVLFYSFLKILQNSSFNPIGLIQIPLSFIIGVLLGICVGLLISYIFKKIKLSSIHMVIIFLGISFLLLALEDILKPYISISSLISIIVIGIIILKIVPNSAKEVQNKYNGLWNVFEILLFALVGCIADVSLVFNGYGVLILLTIFIGLIFRSLGVIICLIKTNFNIKEKLFIIISYMPKATVQASIGPIALAYGLSCGEMVLTAAVIAILLTAPIGAILMDVSYKHLLNKQNSEI